MTQKGEHTWDLIQQFHRCPKCGFIFESRQDYDYRNMKYEKDLECPRCHLQFMVTKAVKPKLGSLLGQDEHVEFDWSDNDQRR